MSRITYPTNFLQMFSSLWRHRDLVWVMTRREVVGRYRGSFLGLLWSFFNPLLLLAVYTFVFSVVFEARWGVAVAGRGQFAVILFAGLIVHGLFSEAIARAPALVPANVNFVKKVVFPLEILPWVSMGATLFHGLMSLLVLFIFILLGGGLHWTFMLIPVVLLPLVLFAMGLSWLLASLGVFIRDIGQAMGLVTTLLLFLCPIFYPLSAIPEKFRPLVYLNPLTFPVEQARAVLVFGEPPSWIGLGVYLAAGLGVAWMGFWWFQKTRKGFADVL